MTKIIFAPAQPHGPLQKLATNVYYIPGSFQFAPLMRISRNMIVLQDGTDLTLINSVRLSPSGEEELSTLGTIKHVIQLGCFHGIDDAYYLDKFQPKFWAPKNSKHPFGVKADIEYDKTTKPPIKDASFFLFTQTKFPEAIILLTQDDGILISCDSVQHHPHMGGCSPMAKVVMTMMGFRKPATIGPPWLKLMTPKNGPSLKEDFDKLIQEKFSILIGGHGHPLLENANETFQRSLRRIFG